jgi:quercetin dioxygenase-like cupin family protein/mannose-6-phosphate isomerase-like protein (cupin superfamily)
MSPRAARHPPSRPDQFEGKGNSMFRAASVGRYYDMPPQREGAGWRSWITRAANFAIVYTEAEKGAVLDCDFADEHFAYALEGAVDIFAGGDSTGLTVEGLAVVPPGPARFSFSNSATLVQVITADESLAAKAHNAATYSEGAKEVAPIEAWPEPVGGYRLRNYDTLAGYAKGGMVHAYRTRKLMIVPYTRFLEPRDETQLSPHSHADFEQASVALEGVWVHHLRVPWTTNRHDWRPDEHVELASPSVTIIPAGVIHTSQGIAGEGMRLIDVFAPPRLDFSQRGWVDNAADYPMPEDAKAS